MELEPRIAAVPTISFARTRGFISAAGGEQPGINGALVDPQDPADMRTIWFSRPALAGDAKRASRLRFNRWELMDFRRCRRVLDHLDARLPPIAVVRFAEP